ncbi:MAG: ABC transporter permease [Pleurocapsa sp. SU_196_0]|nr:ABC transporter permease [Pleurocapsa sp. SU_196_0]
MPRLVRSLVLGLNCAEFVTAARALGGTNAHIVRRHILPALLGPMAVQASLNAGHVLLSIAALSFLGLGVQPPTPEWGAMLTEARAYMQTAPHLVVAPGLAVLGTVFGLNALAEWLEARLNPRRTADS